MNKIKITIFFFLLTILGWGGVSYAQFEFECLGVIDDGSTENKSSFHDCNRVSDAFISKYELLETYIPDTIDEHGEYDYPLDYYPIITVKINFNVWQKSDGTGHWPNSPEMLDIFEDMEFFLNEIFLGKNNNQPSKPISTMYPHVEDTRIRFESEVFYYTDDNYYGLDGWGDPETMLDYIRYNHPERMEGLNINFVHSTINTSGFAEIPQYNNDDRDLHITMRIKQDLPEEIPTGVWAIINLLAHELGHNFRLFHTYFPTCCNEGQYYQPDTSDWLWDVLEEVGDNEWECADPRNGICYHNRGWTCSTTDPLSGCTNNLMGGNASNGFKSPLQIGRMRRALAMMTTRRYASGYSETPFEITSDETWDFSIKFYQDIVIKSGATLTIKCDLQMVPQSKIIVEPGSKLIIDGGRIGTDFFAKDYWSGIFVEGNRTLPQTFANQGAVILQNGAIIENAAHAINLQKYYDNWHHNGGIVQATDAIFKNNKRSVEFVAYANENASGYIRVIKS